ncbi:glutaredoxin [Acetobacter sp. CAG:977]|nr:glutaredoxin [Acetobacter sp. CAG:977]
MTENQAFQRIRQELKDNRVVVFMKGTPAKPRCAFSADAAQCLKAGGISYKSVDVYSDPQLFDGIRQYTHYMHFPQMFVDGRFVGGSDSVHKLAMKKQL